MSISRTEATIPGRSRDTTIDTVKGICIILMVLGHSGFAYSDFIYLFHMTVFFMVSGFLWNDRKVQDLPSLGKYFLSRIKGIWLPYTVCNGIFTLLHNAFVQTGLYAADPWTLRQILINLFKNLFLAGDTQMGGATWFLRTMFFISAAHGIIRYISCHWKLGKVFFICCVVITVAGTVFIDRTNLNLPMGIHTCFSAYSVFLLGMLIRRFDIMAKITRLRGLICVAGFLILLVLDPLGHIGIGAGSITNLPYFFATAVAGWFMVYCLASLLSGFRWLSFCGEHSLQIMLLHFLAFKPVTLVYLLLSGSDLAQLSAFPVFGGVPALWIGYTVVGTTLPLLWVPVKQLFQLLLRKCPHNAAF